MFCRLVSTPSPSGQEADVAKLIMHELSRRGVTAKQDGSKAFTNSNSGNVIATIPGGKRRLTFIAHMDTVEVGDRRIKPTVRGGVIRSDGSTILGADNKAGVAPLICALGEIVQMSKRPTVTGIFSTREEQGTMGVGYLPKGNNGDLVFVLDSEGDVGGFIHKALGSRLFDVEIIGKEAHAALNPEKGANAVKAAGLIITSLKLGRRSHSSILNIGMISGGRKRNIVPGSATLSCGARAFDEKTIRSAINEVDAAAKRACKATGCRYRIRMITDDGAPTFEVNPDSSVVKIARSAAKNLGLKFSISSRMATFEANILAAKGYRPLVMCHGGKLPHSTSEVLKVSDLAATKSMMVELARLSA